MTGNFLRLAIDLIKEGKALNMQEAIDLINNIPDNPVLTDPSIESAIEHQRQLEIAQMKQEQAMRQAFAQMNAQPMQPFPADPIKNEPVIDVYSLLEHCGDLLATGVITAPEWMKLKSLLRSPDHDTVNLAKQIIDAKVEIK